MPQHHKGRKVLSQETIQPAAPVVAKRLCDLLLSFPSSACVGVQWQVLAKRYEEHHGHRLDFVALGHSSALGAATALLWDVLRVVDGQDSDNPVVGVEDGVALTPQPGFMACWPSLYGALCDVVMEHGAPDEISAERDASVHGLLLSQLRPLLESQWHAGFDETSFGFRSEEGNYVRFKKMKHLLHAVLRWRDERIGMQMCKNRMSAVDEVLKPTLELVPSKKHNDLVLLCSLPNSDACLRSREQPSVQFPFDERSCSSPSSESLSDSVLRFEVDRLRAENQELRAKNLQLKDSQTSATSSVPHEHSFECQLPADLFDDPFEPPPQLNSWSSTKSACGSVCTWRTTSTSSGWQSECTSTCASGSMTPVHGHPAQFPPCTVMPSWFPFIQQAASGFVDVSVIPRGIVQSARRQFEHIVV